MSRSGLRPCPYHRVVSESQDADLRIADSEREAAMAVLGEHMSAGRLNIDEYGERSAQVSTAKTRGELRALFTDLPAPHPQFGTGLPNFGTGMPTPGAAPIPAPGQQVAAPINRRPLHAVIAGLVPVAALVAVGLFLLTHLWFFFLIPAAVIVFGRAVWGDNWKRDHHDDRRDYRRDRRDDRRDYRDDRRRDRRGYPDDY